MEGFPAAAGEKWEKEKDENEGFEAFDSFEDPPNDEEKRQELVS